MKIGLGAIATGCLMIACALTLLLLAAGCDNRPASHTYHCKDGTTVSGPGAHASDCDARGGLG